MKLKFIHILSLISCSLSAMQPAQWIRNVMPEVQAELKTEDAIVATKELSELAKDFPYQHPHARKEALIRSTKALLERGANPNAVYKQAGLGLANRQIPIISIAIPHYPEIVKLLLKAGADPDSRAHAFALIDDPILFEAIEKNSEQIVTLLLQYGANPNFDTTVEQTPLLVAIEMGNPEIVRLLLQAGADPVGGRKTFQLLQNFNQFKDVRARRLLSPNSQEFMNVNPPALTLAQKKLAAAQNEPERQRYRAIIEMLEHPETITRTGLQKLL